MTMQNDDDGTAAIIALARAYGIPGFAEEADAEQPEGTALRDPDGSEESLALARSYGLVGLVDDASAQDRQSHHQVRLDHEPDGSEEIVALARAYGISGFAELTDDEVRSRTQEPSAEVAYAHLYGLEGLGKFRTQSPPPSTKAQQPVASVAEPLVSAPPQNVPTRTGPSLDGKPRAYAVFQLIGSAGKARLKTLESEFGPMSEANSVGLIQRDSGKGGANLLCALSSRQADRKFLNGAASSLGSGVMVTLSKRHIPRMFGAMGQAVPTLSDAWFERIVAAQR